MSNEHARRKKNPNPGAPVTPADPAAPNPMVQRIQFEKSVPKELLSLIQKLQKNYPFFSEMEGMEVCQFLKLCERENFASGSKIFKEGEYGNEFYLVISGEIIINVGDKEVARMKPGMVFGEMALLDNAKRTASAVAAEPSLLFSISRTILHSKMPTFGNKNMESIARQLSEKLRDANETIRMMQRQLNVVKEKVKKLQIPQSRPSP